MKFKPFIEARKFVHTLRLNSSSDWLEYCKSRNKPQDIPYSPHTVYKNDWKSWDDWLGNITRAGLTKIRSTMLLSLL